MNRVEQDLGLDPAHDPGRRNADEDLPLAVARRFLGADPKLRLAPFGAGLINATYRADGAAGGFVLQRVNSAVFPAPERIIDNLALLQSMAGDHPHIGVRLPALIAAADGKPFVRDPHGGIWRLMRRIEPSRILTAVQTARQAAEIGRALGRFHRLGAEIDAQRFHVTLPGFHHTPSYLAALEETLAGIGQTAGDCPDALAFIAERRSLANALDDAVRRGLTAPRLIHGDPKLDNLLFDAEGERALCLIDLDTVQPGLIHHDIGDCLRSCCNRRGEAADARQKVCFDLEVCAGILAAYADQVRDLLGSAEIELIYAAIRLIPFELGIRFLTDHLRGDRYFRVGAHGENLHKARVQFALVADIERKQRSIESLVAGSFGAGSVA
jgi:Ser/Thr protein kinase RdoA (MazF antagonist)